MVDHESWQATFREWLISESSGDPAHHLSHIERIVSNSLRIGESENAAPDVLFPSAWLHDCVHVPKDSVKQLDIVWH